MKRAAYLVVTALTMAAAGAGAQTPASADEGAATPLPPAAAAHTVDVRVGGGAWQGYTKYAIGGDVTYADGSTETAPFPMSELEFPMDVFTLTAEARSRFAARWCAVLRGAKTVSGDAGTMEDSDYSPTYFGLERTIYSESDAELDGWELDGSVAYVASRTAEADVLIGVGYLHQYLDYDISNLDQWYPAEPELGHDYEAGMVATYEVTYGIPYVEIVGNAVFAPGARVEGRFAWSPFASASDEDHHLLRGKTAEGDGDGTALMMSAAVQYLFAGRWQATAAAAYRLIDLDGEQTQYEDGELLGSIEEEINSRQLSLDVAIGRLF